MNQQRPQYHEPGKVNEQDDLDIDEFLKSSSSALSDYNFLFDQIDQQLQYNTQTMVEELQKNLPDYLNTEENSLNRGRHNSNQESINNSRQNISNKKENKNSLRNSRDYKPPKEDGPSSEN